MLFTRETDYALRLLRNLSDTEPTSISKIVKKEYISNAIAYKVARKLEHGKLIKSIRGNAGGYQLTKAPDKITVLDVYMVMNPQSMLNECLREDVICPRNVDDSCKLHYELKRIQDILYKELDKCTISEIQ